MNKDIERLIKVILLKSDLTSIDKMLQSPIEKDMLKILLIKNIFLTISNFVDFELTMRSLYQEFPELSKIYKRADQQFQFAKYIRNKFIGHIKEELIQKAIEWRPELKYLLSKDKNENIDYLYNLFILETVINTYVDNDGKHKIFDSDTDLVYPHDINRFLEYLYFIVQSAIEFLNELYKILEIKIDMKKLETFDIEDWIKAGKTDFQFIRK
ncbi:MAG: hypothetical protein GX780_02160 [Campylobacteraceae bacterium]|nr:hypothetical protein [Campylobacteraceae bacterium]